MNFKTKKNWNQWAGILDIVDTSANSLRFKTDVALYDVLLRFLGDKCRLIRFKWFTILHSSLVQYLPILRELLAWKNVRWWATIQGLRGFVSQLTDPSRFANPVLNSNIDLLYQPVLCSTRLKCVKQCFKTWYEKLTGCFLYYFVLEQYLTVRRTLLLYDGLMYSK